MVKKMKYKTFTVASGVLITAVTTTAGVYAGMHLNASAPGSMLAQAVPVGVSTVQQMLLMAWTEFSNHKKETCTA